MIFLGFSTFLVMYNPLSWIYFPKFHLFSDFSSVCVACSTFFVANGVFSLDIIADGLFKVEPVVSSLSIEDIFQL